MSSRFSRFSLFPFPFLFFWAPISYFTTVLHQAGFHFRSFVRVPTLASPGMSRPLFTTFLWHIAVSILLFACSGALAAPALKWQDLSNRAYASYQISDGVGGNAEVEAGAVILAPFHGVELAKVPYDVFEKLSMMWEDIDYANEVAFPRALERVCADDAPGAEDREAHRALAVGKTKNEVLLQTAHFQILQIKLAKYRAGGQDTWDVEDDLDDVEDLLQAAIEEDSANAGQVSMPVQLDFYNEPS